MRESMKEEKDEEETHGPNLKGPSRHPHLSCDERRACFARNDVRGQQNDKFHPLDAVA
jgi:hypothetical protein